MDEFKCQKCNKVLGLTDGQKLVIGGTTVQGACNSKQLRVICSCGTIRAWHPVARKGIAKADKVAIM